MRKRRKTSLPRNVRRRGNKFLAVVERQGKRIKRTFDTVAGAESWARAYKRTVVPFEVLTLTTGFDLLLEELTLKRARPATVSYYRKQFGRLTALDAWDPDIPLHEITEDQVRRFAMKRLEKGNESVFEKDIAALRRILRLAVDRGRLPADPLAKLRAPRRQQQQFHYLPAKTIAALCSAIRGWEGRVRADKSRDADVIESFFWVGWRRTEAVRCVPDDVDLEAEVLRIPLGKCGPRVVPIPPDAIALFARLIAGAQGGLVIGTEDYIEKAFARWQERLEPKLAPRAMRHSFAMAHVRGGTHVFDLMRLMGHASVETTRRYYHAEDAALAQAQRNLRLHPQPESESPPEESDRRRSAT